MPLVTCGMAIASTLKNAGIVPDVIADDVMPKSPVLLAIEYNGKIVEPGMTLSAEETSKAPSVNFVVEDEDAHYIWIMVDLDDPSRENNHTSPWRHWVVVNIPGNDVSKLTETSNIHTPYFGPEPPAGTGDHRYMFLLFKQNEKNCKFDAMASGFNDRERFDYKKFTDGHKLVGVNFFYCAIPGEDNAQ